jgi:DNA (cytosine-5)-methyltransferase 1
MKNNDNKTWGDILKTLRWQRGITQHELSELSGVSYSTLSKIEAGLIKNPSTSTLRKLAAILNANLLNMFTEQNDAISKPTAMGLFAGCGGLDLGFKQAGFEIVYANDILKNCEATYKHNVGDIEIKDFRDVDKSSLPYADVILAGIPCQPFSNAGNRMGVDDDRGQLFNEVIKTIDAKLPKVVLFENVRGFMSSKDENGVLMPERIRLELTKHGYKLDYKLLNASDFEVPQNRYRVVLVGVREDILGDYKFPEPIPKTEAQTIGTVLSKPLPDDEQQEVWALSPSSMNLIELIPEGGSWKSIPYDHLPDRLKRIRDDMKRYHAPNFYRRFARSEIMGTVTAASTPENSGIVHPLENRRYSVREIARFQSFPDDFKFIGTSVQGKYKLIGNAVPVKLGYHVATSIRRFINEANNISPSISEHRQGVPAGSNSGRRRNNRPKVDGNLTVSKLG